MRVEITIKYDFLVVYAPRALGVVMVKLQKVVKWYILQWLQDVINFLLHKAGLRTILCSFSYIYYMVF